MPVSVSPYQGREDVLYFRFEEQWTLEDLFQVLDSVLGYYENRGPDQRLSSITDLRAASFAPTNIVSGLSRIGRHPAVNHIARGTPVVIGGKGINHALAQVFSRLFLELHFTDTLEAAEAIIAEKERIPP